MGQTLMEKIYAYNRMILEQEKKANYVGKVKEMLNTMGDQPDLAELLLFLKRLRELLKEF